jgi:hypothetical protein
VIQAAVVLLIWLTEEFVSEERPTDSNLYYKICQYNEE